MNLDWMGLYFYRLFERAKYSEMISFWLVCMPDRAPRAFCAGAVGAAQAGPTLQFLVRGNPTVGQLIPAVSIEVRVLRCRAYAQRFLKDQLHGPVRSL